MAFPPIRYIGESPVERQTRKIVMVYRHFSLAQIIL